MTLFIALLFAVGHLMNPPAAGKSGSGGSCGATQCITTEAGSNLQTEAGSNIITES